MRGNAAGAEDEPTRRPLDRVPEWVVPLGAGCLAAATLVTLVGSLFGWYAVLAGRSFGYPTYYVVLATAEFTVVTLVQAVGTRWARNRVKWMYVMLAALFGALTFVVLPLTLLAVVLLGLGKRHFSSHAPAAELMEE